MSLNGSKDKDIKIEDKKKSIWCNSVSAPLIKLYNFK